jgi:hypothetical protein
MAGFDPPPRRRAEGRRARHAARRRARRRRHLLDATGPMGYQWATPPERRDLSTSALE